MNLEVAFSLVVIGLPFLGWLVKKYIDKLVGAKFDIYKKEHEVKFSWQHQRVTESSEIVYKNFVVAHNKVQMLVGDSYRIDMGVTKNELKELTLVINKFSDSVSSSDIFLPDHIKSEVRKSLGHFLFIHNTLLQSLMFKDEKDTKLMSKCMINASKINFESLHPQREKLEKNFRLLLLEESWD